jgi:hypothetical protein
MEVQAELAEQVVPAAAVKVETQYLLAVLLETQEQQIPAVAVAVAETVLVHQAAEMADLELLFFVIQMLLQI